jgi:hypothetical protein
VINRPGDDLARLIGEAREEVVLCAPFAKQPVLERLLDPVPTDVRVELFTRWRPEEIASGVSDTGVLQIVEDRGGRVWLLDELHAKYFRHETRGVAGSANLTGRALGWSIRPNVELLIPAPMSSLQELETLLRKRSTRGTIALAHAADEAAEALPKLHLDEVEVAAGGREWVPQLRQPEDLFRAYHRGPSALSSASAAASRVDLQFLDLPIGLDEEPFHILVAQRVLTSRIGQELDLFLDRPRRFGEVRSLLEEQLGLDREQADHAWQTWMRWLLYFFPERYERSVPRRTEVINRRKGIL